MTSIATNSRIVKPGFIVRVIESGIIADTQFDKREDAEFIFKHSLEQIGHYPYLENVMLLHVKPNGEVTRLDVEA